MGEPATNASTGRRAKITKRVVDASGPAAERYEVWDTELRGFGLRVSPSGIRTFIVRYRAAGSGAAGARRRVTLGRYGPLTVEKAREKAKAVLGAVAGGKDPAAEAVEARSAVTVEEMARRYVDEHVSKKHKPDTAVFYRSLIDRFIVPALGAKKAAAVTRADVARLHSGLSATPYQANRVLAVLGALYTWGDRCGYVPEGTNPTRRVQKYREARRERFLSTDELARLGEVLREAEVAGLPWDVDETKPTAKHLAMPERRRTIYGPHVTGAIRLLILTGCRVREILDLEWDHVDFQRAALFLPDSKTGRKVVMLGAAALQVLAELPRVGRYVVPGSTPDRPRADLKKPWGHVARRAGLERVRLHDLRHTHAATGAGLGLGLPIIGKLLGHSQASTTQRYAHLADDPVRRAADTVTATLAASMAGNPAGNVTELPARKAQ